MFPTKSFDDEHHREEQALRHAKVINDVMKYDENNNPLPYINRALTVKAEGDIHLLSPKNFALCGGSNVIYVASNHHSGQGKSLFMITIFF